MRNPFDNDERRAFRATIARFVKQEIEPFGDVWDEAGTFPWAVHARACALGLFGFGIDESYGGLGFDDAFMRTGSAEELGLSGIGGVVASIGARGIMVGLVNALASEELKARSRRFCPASREERSPSPSPRVAQTSRTCRRGRGATAIAT